MVLPRGGLLGHEHMENRTVLLYQILFNIMPWQDKKLATIEKPCFIHGKHIRSKMYYDIAYVMFSYINGNKEEIEVTTTSQYK